MHESDVVDGCVHVSSLRIVYIFIQFYHAYCWWCNWLCAYDVDVSAYEYVNVYADDNGYVYRYLCMYELENEKWLARL